MPKASPVKKQRTEDTSAPSTSYATDLAHHTDYTVPSRERAIAWVTRRLLDPRSIEAASTRLRPSLQKIHDDLCAALCNTVESGQSLSIIAIGDPGAGKTLVSRCTQTVTAVHVRLHAAPHTCKCVMPMSSYLQ